jgi:tellurium resistance protein TerD
MAVSLQKGGRVSLTKEAPGLKNIHVGLGWKERETEGTEFDLDASAFLLDGTGKVPSDAHFVFYGTPKSDDGMHRAPDGSVEYTGDNRSGASSGDAEVINVYLDKIPESIAKVAFTVTIYDAEARRQSFGQVSNAYIRLVNKDTNEEVVRFDLGEDFSTENAVVFAELYRNGDDWKFNAIGQGYSGGLAALGRAYGVNIG